MLQSHDWWWFNSDSASKQDKGRAMEAEIKKKASSDKQLYKMWETEYNKVYKTKRK